MNAKAFVSVFAVLALLFSGIAVMSDGSDAANETWTDPNYRDPPAADYVIQISQDFAFDWDDPTYIYYIDIQGIVNGYFSGVSSDSQDDASAFIEQIQNFYFPDSGLTWSDSYKIDNEKDPTFFVDVDNINGYTDACLPSWIQTCIYQVSEELPDATAISDLGFGLSISPALQQMNEYDTHGDYWIYFSFTKTTDHLIGSDDVSTKTFLIEFDVDVHGDESGGPIVDPSKNQVQLVLDYGSGDVRTLSPISIDEGQLSVTFELPDDSEAPVRDGYRFLGFSTEPNGDVIESETIAVLVSDLGPGEDGEDGTLYTFTIYAIWELDDDPVPTPIPDPLRDILELLSDPWVMLLVFAIVFGLAYLVRMRRIGGY